MKTGTELIAEERLRQIDGEGYTAEHDDAHPRGELAQAAMCYTHHALYGGYAPLTWPWDYKWWKPGKGRTVETRVRALTKAGALIAAEIDRLQRVNAK
jgi:hypothetical protein